MVGLPAKYAAHSRHPVAAGEQAEAALASSCTSRTRASRGSTHGRTRGSERRERCNEQVRNLLQAAALCRPLRPRRRPASSQARCASRAPSSCWLPPAPREMRLGPAGAALRPHPEPSSSSIQARSSTPRRPALPPATALSGPAAVTPGSTIWLRGGTYTNAVDPRGFESTLMGTTDAPIVVRQYPGEHATVTNTLLVTGPYTWFWGFEVTHPAPQQQETLHGVNVHGPGTKLINLVVHDATDDGIFIWPQAAGAEVNGSTVYNNGRTNN